VLGLGPANRKAYKVVYAPKAAKGLFQAQRLWKFQA